MTQEKKPEVQDQYKACRVCGSEELVAGDAMKGTEMPLGAIPCLTHAVVPIGLSKIGLQTGEILVVLLDACKDCGTVRVIHSQLQKAEMKVVGGPFGGGDNRGKGSPLWPRL